MRKFCVSRQAATYRVHEVQMAVLAWLGRAGRVEEGLFVDKRLKAYKPRQPRSSDRLSDRQLQHRKPSRPKVDKGYFLLLSGRECFSGRSKFQWPE